MTTNREKALAAVRAKVPACQIDGFFLGELALLIAEAAYEAGMAERAAHYDKAADDMRAEVEQLRSEIRRLTEESIADDFACRGEVTEAIQEERARCLAHFNRLWSARYPTDWMAAVCESIKTGEPAPKGTP